MNVRRLVWTPRPCIGVDPGTTGAAAWFDGTRWGAATWRNRSQAMSVLGSLGAGFGAAKPALGVEAITYMGKAKGKNLITLSEAAGWALGALGVLYDGEVLRPTAQKWQHEVLGIQPGTDAPTAEPIVMAACHGTLPITRPGVLVDLGFTIPVRTGHEADAVCIALWAAGARLGPRGSG